MMHGTQTYISSCVQPQHYLNFSLTEVAVFPGRAGGQGPTDAGLTSAQFSLAYERHERVGKISAANASHKTLVPGASSCQEPRPSLMCRALQGRRLLSRYSL